MEKQELLRPRDLAAPLGVSTYRVYQLLRGGIIPHVVVGGSIRIPRGAWESWLAEQNRLAQTTIGRQKAAV
jgi:excisionase family DNA binding protein